MTPANIEKSAAVDGIPGAVDPTADPALMESALNLAGQKAPEAYDTTEGHPGIKRIEKLVANTPGALSKTSPMEWGMRIAGGTGGALLGYWLAGKIHEKPRKLIRLLYTLGGGAAGAYIGDALVSDRARLSARLENAFKGNKEYRDAVNAAHSGNSTGSYIGMGTGAVLGSGVGYGLGKASGRKLEALGRLIKGKGFWSKAIGYPLIGAGKFLPTLGFLGGCGGGVYVGNGIGGWTDDTPVTDITGTLMQRGMKTT